MVYPIGSFFNLWATNIMLILLSPAKRLDFSPTERELSATQPALHSEAKKLAAVAKKLSPQELAKLMSLSDKLADTAHGYFSEWKSKWDAKETKQAILAFRGDVYQGFEADTLADKQLEKAQDQIRILSGLYGVLRPLDLIQAYRLEMGRKLKNPRGNDLYEWWGDRVTEMLNQDLQNERKPLVVNLASNEYWAVVNKKLLDAEVVTPVFKDKKGSQYKVISFYAKRARGLMARHLIRSRAAGSKAIESFNQAGYSFNPSLSTSDCPVFTREEAVE